MAGMLHPNNDHNLREIERDRRRLTVSWTLQGRNWFICNDMTSKSETRNLQLLFARLFPFPDRLKISEQPFVCARGVALASKSA